LKNSHLDITHYEQIPKEKLKEIEKIANEIVKKGIKLNLTFMPRSEAERKFGMSIYQGGAVPGKKIRIVEIPGVDVEACGGTHLNNTSETGVIKILKSQKIQDGIVRLIYTAGKATDKVTESYNKILNEISNFLGVKKDLIVGRVKELQQKWKNLNKALKTGKINEDDFELKTEEKYDGDILEELSQIFKVKIEEIPAKIKKLYQEWEENKNKLSIMRNLLDSNYINELIKNAEKINGFKLIIKKFDDLNQNDLKNFSIRLMKQSEDLITLFINQTPKGIMLMGMLAKKPAENTNLNIGNLVKKTVEHFGGKGGGKKDYGQGFIGNSEIKAEQVIDFINQNLKLE
ncbi:MAG: DHHA1 domain-containing protein, partial [Promethearchaeota archaeon]